MARFTAVDLVVETKPDLTPPRAGSETRRKGRISDNANTLTNVVLGMGVIAGAAVLYGFAGQLTDLVFGTG